MIFSFFVAISQFYWLTCSSNFLLVPSNCYSLSIALSFSSLPKSIYDAYSTASRCAMVSVTAAAPSSLSPVSLAESLLELAQEGALMLFLLSSSIRRKEMLLYLLMSILSSSREAILTRLGPFFISFMMAVSHLSSFQIKFRRAFIPISSISMSFSCFWSF